MLETYSQHLINGWKKTVWGSKKELIAKQKFNYRIKEIKQIEKDEIN